MRVINKNTLTANQQYKLSGSVLPFKDWLNREKQKGEVIPKSGVTDVINDLIQEEKELYFDEKEIEVKDTSSNTFLGLNKSILIFSALIIVGAVAYKTYNKNK
jgi:hypothetical protein